MKLPKNVYDRKLTQEECRQLLEKGWRMYDPQPCRECHGRGCNKCYYVGLVVTLFNNDQFYFGVPPISKGNVGARCIAIYSPYDKKLHVQFNGGGGEARVAFYYGQLFKLMQTILNCVCSPNDHREIELGVEGEFRGPPVMKLAALTKNRVTISTIPSDRQEKAIKLLKDAGLVDEAQLLHSAFEHEVFRGDCEEREKARAIVGEIKPGTIFNRKENSVVTDSGEVVTIDPDKSILS